MSSAKLPQGPLCSRLDPGALFGDKQAMTKPAMPRLPIDDALPDLIAALHQGGRAVLQAPPGAGKTTKVPLAMLSAGLTAQRIVMLEPRRLAARAAAERMAETLGEAVGQTVGYRIRGEAKTSKATRIEVVTEGILTRMLQSDPDLPGIGAVIFDEFHERSLNADLGLALCLEVLGRSQPRRHRPRVVDDGRVCCGRWVVVERLLVAEHTERQKDEVQVRMVCPHLVDDRLVGHSFLIAETVKSPQFRRITKFDGQRTAG